MTTVDRGTKPAPESVTVSPSCTERAVTPSGRGIGVGRSVVEVVADEADVPGRTVATGGRVVPDGALDEGTVVVDGWSGVVTTGPNVQVSPCELPVLVCPPNSTTW